jgi:hypothetical protein
MAAKGKRMGRDPLRDRLGWIEDSRTGAKGPRAKPAPGEELKEKDPETAQAETGESSVRKGLKPGDVRATFIVKEELLEKLKGLAYWERKPIKRLVDEALSIYLEKRKAKKRPKTGG